LRIPAEVWSGGQFSGTRDYIQFSRSWDAEKGLVRDEGVHKERIRITFQGGFPGAPRNDGDQRMQELMRSRSGPEPTEDKRVQEYSSANGASDVFVISNLDESGRYSTAECGWHLCKTSFLRRSRIRVNYRFSRQFVGNWVAIDQAVRALVTSFELEK
jgi:hypothetical protein